MIGHLLNRSLAVWRESTTTDSGGGQTTGWWQAGTTRARLSQPSAAELQVAQRHGARLSHVVYAPPEADIGRGDQLRDDEGLVLEVLATVVPSERIYLRCECESQTDKET